MFLRRLITWLFLFAVVPLNAQQPDPSAFSLYTTAKGLSHNYVADIEQDSTGYIWVATAAGLNRFNGSQFVQFHSNDNPNSLPSEELSGTTWLGRNQLGVFTSGLHIVNTKTGRTRNIFIPYHNKKYQFKFNMIMSAKGDADDNIYVLTRSGFYHFDRDDRIVSRFDYFSEEEVPVTHFHFGTQLLELDANRLLIISTDGLYIYNKPQKKFHKMSAADSPLFNEFLDYKRKYQFFQPAPNEIFVAKSESDTIVYINTAKKIRTASKVSVNPLGNEIGWRSKLVKVNDSVYYLTAQYSGFFKMTFKNGNVKLDSAKYFQQYLCTSLLTDNDKNLWVGTNRGLFRQNTQYSAVHIASLPDGIENSFPNIRFFDTYVSKHKIYAGTTEGGMFVFDKSTMAFEKQFPFSDKEATNYVRSIEPVDSSTLILGTYGPLLFFDMKRNSAKKVIPPGWHVGGDWTSDIMNDSKGNSWISAHTIYKYNHRSKTFTSIPTYDKLLEVPFVMAEDRDGNIWMGCHGLARYNTKLNQYDVYIDSFPYIKMPDKQIGGLIIDQRNTLWFNTNNNGLVAYDIIKKSFRHFTRKDGLPDDNIASLLAVGNKLWIACYSGLACIDIYTSQIVSFGKEDGFPDMPIYKNSKLFFDKDLNQLYVGFSNAIARFNPDSIIRRKSPPRIFFENLVVNGKENIYLPDAAIATSWKDGELMITIGSISFCEGNSQRFAYRIVKDERTPWVMMGSQPSFSISGLAPGAHRIQVKAFSPNNRWPDQVKELTINVSSPLWKKDWFFAASALLLLGLIYLVIKWRTESVRKKEKEKTHIEALKAEHYKNQFELEQISNYFSSSLTAKETVDEVLWDVAENLIGRMNYEDCIIYIWNRDKTKMIQKAAWGPKGKPEVISADGFEVAPGQGIVGHVIETKQPVLVNDTRKDTRYRVDDEFRLSEVAVPIIHNDELLGVIDSENSKPNYFSERDIKILTTIATLIGNKLKQIESERSLEAKQKELLGINEQLAEARLSALQAQMNPHFVFNALNSIKRMILDGDNDKASRYLSKFALMIRMTLEHSKEVFVTLDENIEYLRAYLDMEQLRFDDSFRYSIEVDDSVDTSDTSIPSMMIQPLVENAIWHGLMQSEGNKKINIDFNQEGNKIICTVEDNGIGIRRSEKLREKQRPLHRSVGLENLQKRIRIMNEKYQTNCSLQIIDLYEKGVNGGGTRAVLQFNQITTHQKI